MAVSAPDQVMAVLVKKGSFSDGEQDTLLAYTRRAGLEATYVPKAGAPGPLREFLNAPDRAALVRDFPRDISPTTDDRPYFFNFTKWSNPLAAKAHADEVPSVSEGTVDGRVACRETHHRWIRTQAAEGVAANVTPTG